jgi:amidase
MGGLTLESAVNQVLAINKKKVTALELLEMHVKRIEEQNPGLNAIVHMDLDTARKKAKEADQALAEKKSLGPLHGLPMTVKDTLEVAGMPCTSGSPRLKTHVPAKHADVVQSLVDAGAVIFGKTNVPLFGGDFQSFNDVYGISSNPWNLKTTPGGSSGGAAAAVAAGLSALELGSDIAGSIRVPAHFCGIYGHKPSYGIVSQRGHVPPMPGIFTGEYSLDIDILVIGPLARNIDDISLVMDLITAPSQPENRAWQINLPHPRGELLSDLKIAVWPDDPVCPIDSSVGDLFSRTIDRLAAKGANLREAKPDFRMADSHALFLSSLAAVIGAGTPDKYFGEWKKEAAGLSPDDRSYKAAHLRGATLLHKHWIEIYGLRQILRQKWAEFFRIYDVLLCPTAPVTAIEHDHAYLYDRLLTVNGRPRPYMDLSAWAGLAGVAYLPATTAPMGLSSAGMPAGIQIVGPYLEDKTTIATAKLMEAVTGGFTQPPAP